MPSVTTPPRSEPRRALAPGEALVTEGEPGGNLYVLESGTLRVERNGVALATLDRPNALIGEMSVLLGSRNSATVRAVDDVVVRTIVDADRRLMEDPALCFEVAVLLAGRLEATSALLVKKSAEDGDRGDKGFLASLFSALTAPGDATRYVVRRDLFEP